MIDLFYEFTDAYEEGNTLEALQKIFKTPNIKFDSLSSKNPAFRFLLNYADACVYQGDWETLITRQTLYENLIASQQEKVLLDRFLERLVDEQKLRHLFISNAVESEKIPPFYRSLIAQKRKLVENVKRFSGLKPQLIPQEADLYTYPWHVFAYPIQPDLAQIKTGDEIPCIFLQPLQNFDYEEFNSILQYKPILFICDTLANLYHILHSNHAPEVLGNMRSVIYIMELYPQEQLTAQNIACLKRADLKAYHLIPDLFMEKHSPLIIQAILQCIHQPEEDLTKETPIYNQLYHLAKRLLFNKEALRYGKVRAIAHSIQANLKEWYDPHKGLPAHSLEFPPQVDYFSEILTEASAKRKARQKRVKDTLKIAHVASQLVDGGHAPSRLIRNMLMLCDRTRFEPSLFLTEVKEIYPQEYPVRSHFSPSSKERGVQSIQLLEDLDIQVFIAEKRASYQETAEKLSDQIDMHDFDLVVFHGPDEMNCLIASLINCPVRVLFEHGTLPKYDCFEGVILSSYEASQIHQNSVVESIALPFSIDVRKEWIERPYTRKKLGVPDNAFIMTTISNHLKTRLSTEMCHAIGEILKANPHAWYLPMGPIPDEAKFRCIFERYGVNQRIKFLGSVDNPSQYARSMNLYLNEFPFGSGLGILDAMAAGCPVISMYDNQGPPQSRYGGAYFGIDRMVKSGKTEDYVLLANKLIQDQKSYQEWSKHALEQYEKHVDEKAYMKAFERFLEKISGKQSG